MRVCGSIYAQKYNEMKKEKIALLNTFIRLGLISSSFLPVMTQAVTTWSGVATADAFVTTGPTDDLTANNYGGAGALMVSADLSEGEMESFLKFDLTEAKILFDAEYGVGQWTVTGVTLELFSNYGTGGEDPGNPIFNTIAAGSFAVDWMSNDTWIEGTGKPSKAGTEGIAYDTVSDYTSEADLLLGTYDWLATGNGGSTYELDFVGGFLDDIYGGDLVSFHFYANDTEVSYLFNSHSYNDPSYHPQLLISVIPEPAAWSLLGLPMMLGAWIIRRRRS